MMLRGIRVAGTIAAVALMGAVAQGQIWKGGAPASGMKVQTLTAAAIDKAMPLLQEDAASGKLPGADRFAQVGMTKTEYVAVKNALMIAKLDDADQSRLALPFDDGSLTARRGNITLYRSRAGRLGALLAKAEVDGSCALCRPAGVQRGGR